MRLLAFLHKYRKRYCVNINQFTVAWYWLYVVYMYSPQVKNISIWFLSVIQWRQDLGCVKLMFVLIDVNINAYKTFGLLRGMVAITLHSLLRCPMIHLCLLPTLWKNSRCNPFSEYRVRISVCPQSIFAFFSWYNYLYCIE